ncbi:MULTISPECIES: anhydro-N-acetylmuramic acid kinase [unclassified Winogradskyella]|uniref:anhydro-N-acetylmuramic acid kinase n=1 Tax=unclassified Winogradskyella TaxID=2615021 RepID=UPI002FEEC1E8
MTKFTYKVIGVMSGTSLDGIDLIYATYDVVDAHWDFKIHDAETVKYSAQWKLQLGALVNQSMDQLQDIDSLYSKYLATVISTFIKQHHIKDIDFIASHGHTALHQPKQGVTYQIGNLQVLADVLNEKVICDFRVQDVEFGGQGAPLVPIGDRLLFKDFDYCLNLGGFANVSFESKNKRIAFDICPVNIVLNYYVSKLNLEYDDKGKIASTGQVNEALLFQLNTLRFYNEQAPKSLGLEWVELNIFPLIEPYKLETKDILRTFIEHVAIQVSRILTESNTKVLVTGGGVYNDFLMDRINHFSKSKIVIPENEIIEFKEALIFGLLGVLKERNEVNCLKSVTGANQNHSSGKRLIPKNLN